MTARTPEPSRRLGSDVEPADPARSAGKLQRLVDHRDGA